MPPNQIQKAFDFLGGKCKSRIVSCITRQKYAEKRSSHTVNKHFERIFNVVRGWYEVAFAYSAMVIFWLTTIAMLGVGLVLILPPMLGRDRKEMHGRQQINATIYRERILEIEQQHQDREIDETELARARSELQRAALSDLGEEDLPTPNQDRRGRDTFIALLIAIAIPCTAFGLYFQMGNTELVTDPAAYLQSAEHDGTPGTSAKLPSMEEMVARLVERLEEQPDDVEGWFMLGRSYAAMRRLDEADKAFAEAYRLKPDSPQILVKYAEFLAQRNGGSLEGRPSELIEAALDVAPDSPTALWFAGIAAYQKEDHHQAIEYWERLQKGGKMGEEEQKMLTEILAEARKAAGITPWSSD